MNRFTKWFKKYLVPHKANDYKPHLLRHEAFMIAFTLIIVLELAFLVQLFVVFDKTKFLASVLPGVLTTLTNGEREDNDVSPLKENPLLVRAAQLKAEDMAKKGYFAHTSPEGLTPWHWLREVGYSYRMAGENLAVNFFESEDVSRAWMNSPTHRANIVKEEYTEIGIGVANGVYQGRNTVFVAQFFGTPFAIASEPKKEVTEEPKESQVEENPIPEITPTPEDNQIAVNLNETEILGDENTAVPVSTESISSKQGVVASFFQNVLTSPRKSVGYIYALVAVFFLLSLTLVFFIRSELRHPATLARGAAMIVFIGLLSFVNLKVIDIKTEVPTDNRNFTAIAVEALE